MMDLQEDRSLIRGLLAQGLDVYLIDWGYPDGADRFTTLADYIERSYTGASGKSCDAIAWTNSICSACVRAGY